MMIRYMSDLHLEIADMEDVCAGGDVLVLAGDITAKNRVDWINTAAEKFKDVIYIAGNHEYYGGNMDSVERHLDEDTADNVHFLNNQSVTIDGHTFHGCTLWTDYNRQNVMDMMVAEGSMNDFKRIRNHKYSKLTAQYVLRLHMLSKLFLMDNVKKGDIVITHHAPSALSTPERFKGDVLNSSYVSDQSGIMFNNEPALWFHGHMHNTFDYEIGNTRVLANPRGYGGIEVNDEFNPYKTVLI